MLGYQHNNDKEKQVTYEITLNDGMIITPSYAPEHHEGVCDFYADALERGEISAWRVL